MTTFLVLAVGMMLIGLLIVHYSPAFGGRPSPERLHKYSQSENFRDGRFTNQVPTSMAMSGKAMLSILRDFLKGTPDHKPARAFPSAAVDFEQLQDSEARVTWFGHSALLIELDGKRLLLDPMFGRSPSPFPSLGGQRFSGRVPLDVEALRRSMRYSSPTTITTTWTMAPSGRSRGRSGGSWSRWAPVAIWSARESTRRRSRNTTGGPNPASRGSP